MKNPEAILNDVPVVRTNGLQRAAGIGVCKAMPIDADRRPAAGHQPENAGAVPRD